MKKKSGYGTEKNPKKASGTLCAIGAFLLVFLAVSTLYHHIMLNVEADKIVPNGTMVEVNGHSMHVYSEGAKSDKPTLVFLSGWGTVAPVYNFKSLYAEFSGEYRIAVVEKAGYGYSECRSAPRNVQTVLSETRRALALAGESGPYVLFPHSMSGIEAIYWAQQDPKEIAGIVGLDMAVPEDYGSVSANLDFMLKLEQAAVWMGLHRSISGVYPLCTSSLTQREIDQQRYLMYRNALNSDFLLEGEQERKNAQIVEKGGIPGVPILMFVSDGKHLAFGENLGDHWIPCAKKFARAAHAKLVFLPCGHYIQNYEPETIAKKSLIFLGSSD